jgi:hypothetical protein
LTEQWVHGTGDDLEMLKGWGTGSFLFDGSVADIRTGNGRLIHSHSSSIPTILADE